MAPLLAVTARHFSSDGQEAAETYFTSDGTFSTFQVDPLLVVEMMAPLVCSPPVAIQEPDDLHVIPESCVTAAGTACLCQVIPPFAVLMMAGAPDSISPTATHVSTEEHETAANAPVRSGALPTIQRRPPFVVMMTIPPQPTATQFFVVEHQTSVKILALGPPNNTLGLGSTIHDRPPLLEAMTSLPHGHTGANRWTRDSVER